MRSGLEDAIMRGKQAMAPSGTAARQQRPHAPPSPGYDRSSWLLGYDSGLAGEPKRCPAYVDMNSFFAGHDAGRAAREG